MLQYSGLSEAEEYYIEFTDKFDNVYTTLIEAPYPTGYIQVPILNNPDFPAGLFTQHSGMFKMRVLNTTTLQPFSFYVGPILTTCVLITFKQFEGVILPAIIIGD